MTWSLPASLTPILQIIWIDLVLSGDNAVVIALACRALAKTQRFWGITLGTAAAIVLRILLTFVVLGILQLPYVRLVGGLLLLWIAVRLALEDQEGKDVPEAKSIFAAVRIIVVADAIMSLDNVMAIAAAAKGSLMLVIFGLALSVPLILFSAGMFLMLLQRFPILIWLGAAVLGYVAGDLIGTEKILEPYPITHSNYFEIGCGMAGAVISIVIALVLKRRAHHAERA